jgi:hypothetical protein
MRPAATPRWLGLLGAAVTVLLVALFGAGTASAAAAPAPETRLGGSCRRYPRRRRAPPRRLRGLVAGQQPPEMRLGVGYRYCRRRRGRGSFKACGGVRLRGGCGQLRRVGAACRCAHGCARRCRRPSHGPDVAPKTVRRCIARVCLGFGVRGCRKVFIRWLEGRQADRHFDKGREQPCLVNRAGALLEERCDRSVGR